MASVLVFADFSAVSLYRMMSGRVNTTPMISPKMKEPIMRIIFISIGVPNFAFSKQHQVLLNCSVITGTDYRAASGYNLHSVAAARQ